MDCLFQCSSGEKVGRTVHLPLSCRERERKDGSDKPAVISFFLFHVGKEKRKIERDNYSFNRGPYINATSRAFVITRSHDRVSSIRGFFAILVQRRVDEITCRVSDNRIDLFSKCGEMNYIGIYFYCKNDWLIVDR